MELRSGFLPIFLLLLSLTISQVCPKESPFTAKAALNRYWNSQISNKLSKPSFFFSKASPLNAVDLAVLTASAEQKQNALSLSDRFDSFCSSANMFCRFDAVARSGRADRASRVPKHGLESNFAHYSNRQFLNYGSGKLGGSDSFKNYSDGLNLPTDSFSNYSEDSTGHSGSFSSYARDANVANGTFTSYGSGATGGSDGFDSYDTLVNVPHLRFGSYDQNANNHKLTFTTYSAETNSGDETFLTYGTAGNGAPAEFKAYAEEANTIGSTFTGYGDSGNGANDTFKGYGDNGNNPHNNFKNYGTGGNAGVDSFSNYRDGANVGDDTFLSYAKDSTSGKVNFANYGKTFNEGTDLFKEYAKGAKNQAVEFKIYGLNTTFNTYVDKGVTFAMYTKSAGDSPTALSSKDDSVEDRGSSASKIGVVKSFVEQGKFFREAELREGNVMVMPDIRDKMPQRSFLPRSITSKLPFSSSSISQLKKIFHARDGGTLEQVMTNSLAECERSPSRGETKKCVGSAEDMIDFATSVLGHNLVVRTTENVKGSKGEVLIGKVTGINDGKVTKSVSCHQSLYPYLLYYCHSVPDVRVYEVELLEVKSKERMNTGVAICHIDTSAWSSTHGAFLALGSGPGKIEVCHWIFENDMTWATADI